MLVRVIVAIVLLLAAAFARAGQADLVLTASLSPPAPYVPGQTVQLTLTITNLGPDIAGEDAVGPIPPVNAASIVRVNDQNRLPLVIRSADPVACPLEYVDFDPPPGDRPGIIYVVYYPRMNVGETRSCTLDVTIDSSQSADVVVRWQAFSAQDTDPNLTNNAVDVLFGVVTTIPVPTNSMAGLVMLAISMAVVAFTFFIRRRRANEEPLVRSD